MNTRNSGAWVTKTPYRRLNLLTGEWVWFPPQQMPRSPQHSPQGKNDVFSSAEGEYPRRNVAAEAKDDVCRHNFVFMNDYTALLPLHVLPERLPAGETEPRGQSLLRSGGLDGDCRVACHSRTPPETSATDLRGMIDFWVQEYAVLSEKYRWVQIFESRERIMTETAFRPNGQVWAGSFLPNEPAKEDAQQSRYFAEHRSLLLLDYLEEEMRDGTRTVDANDHWVALVPRWAEWPFELLLLPRRAVGSLPDLDDRERNDLADIFKAVFTRYDNLFGMTFPCSVSWHGRPGKNAPGEDFLYWQLHAHFYPPILRSASEHDTVPEFRADSDVLSQEPCHIAPEEAAERLRSSSTRFWRFGAEPAEPGRGSVGEDTVCDSFRRRFAGAPEFVVRSPGRVNLMGGQAGRSDGLILAATVDRAVWMACRPRDDGVVCIYSAVTGDEYVLDMNAGIKKEFSSLSQYATGCAWTLREGGYPLTGFNAVIDSDIPNEAGFSTAAAQEVATLLAFAEAGSFQLPNFETAFLGRNAEGRRIGMRSDFLDRAACVHGQAGKAMLLDCDAGRKEYYDLPGNIVVAVLDTATRYSADEFAFAERRGQCEAACRAMGVSRLRDATQEMLDKHKNKMSEVVFRRARHVLSDNLRVAAAAAALTRGATDSFGKLINESHFSLHYDYEASSYELDAITTLARRHFACFGACMTDSGFGGSAVALLCVGAESDFVDWLTRRYRRETEKIAHVHICRVTDGARVKRL